MFQEKIQVAQLNTSVPNSSLETFARLTGSSRVTGAGWAPARGGSRICGRTLAETTFGRTEYDNWSCPCDLEVLLRGATLGQNGAEYLGHNMITAWRAML